MQQISPVALIPGNVYTCTASAGNMGLSTYTKVFVRLQDGIPVFYDDAFKTEILAYPNIWTFFTQSS
jgi:hypothetical protein